MANRTAAAIVNGSAEPLPSGDILTDGGGVVIPTVSSTHTLTNKDLTSASNTFASVTTTATAVGLSPTGGARENEVYVTAQAGSLGFNTPSGAPANGNKLIIRIKDNGTARAISWNSAYRSVTATLPTTTVAGKVTYVGLRYNSQDSIWDCLAVGTQP